MLGSTNIVKNSLDYCFNDLKKLLLLTGFYIISNLLLIGGIFVLLNSFIKTMPIDATTVGMFFNKLLGAIPLQNIMGFIIFFILAFIIFIFIEGYIYRIIEKAINKEEVWPEFNNYKLLFVQGLKTTVLDIIYMIIPIILIFIGFNMLFNVNILNIGVITQITANPNYMLVYLGEFLIIIGGILSIILSFIQIMALNNLIANNGKFSHGLKLKEIINIIKDVGYLQYIGTIIFVVIIGFIIESAANIIFILCNIFGFMIPFVGILFFIITFILGILVSSYLSVFVSRAFGLLYNEREDI